MKTIKSLLLLYMLMIQSHAFSQEVDSITKIIINYSKGFYPYKTYTTYERTETIELTKTIDNHFKISAYFKTTAATGKTLYSIIRDTFRVSTKQFAIIKQKTIDHWVKQLNNNQDVFTVSFVKPHLISPTDKEILQTAKKYNHLDLLRDEDFDKEDREQVRKAINEMKSFTGLDSFLAYRKPFLENYVIVMHALNSMKIRLIEKSDTTEYSSSFLEPLGQPIRRSLYKNKKDYTDAVNIEANTAAQAFLPKNSTIYKILDLNNIKEDYIKWYLEHRM